MNVANRNKNDKGDDEINFFLIFSTFKRLTRAVYLTSNAKKTFNYL